MVSLQLALSPQFASLVGAGIMLLLMMKMARFFYRLPNVSRPDQMPESDHILVGASLRGTAFCLSPVVAPAYFWFLSFKITASTIQDFSGGSDGKESTCNAGDLGLICELGRSLWEGMAIHSSILFFIYLFFKWRIIALQIFVVFCQTSTLQYSCLKNPHGQDHKELDTTEWPSTSQN